MTSTVTPYSDMAPSPRVAIDLDPADLSGDTVTVWQVSQAGQYPVIGAISVDPSSGVVVTDYRPPVGVDVIYRVQTFTGGVETGWTLNLPTFIPFPDGMVVLSDPLVPELAVMVEGKSDFAGQIRRPQSSNIVMAGGRQVALRSRRSLIVGVRLPVQTKTLADGAMLESLLAAGSDVLVRVSPTHGRLPAVFFASFADPVEIPIDVQYGGQWIIWDLVADEVSPNTLPLLKATVTWDRVKAVYATWDDLKAAYPTWNDIKRNPPPEV